MTVKIDAILARRQDLLARLSKHQSLKSIFLLTPEAVSSRISEFQMAIFKSKYTFFGWGHLVPRGYSSARRDPKEAFLALRMAAWVVALSLMVRMLPLPRALQMLTPRRHRRTTTDDNTALEKRLARSVDALLGIGKLVFTPTCWKRAAVLYRYLALNGIETHIVFGIRRETEGLLAGHAWLEAGGGRPVLEATAPDYTVTYCFPPQISSRKHGV